MATTKTKQPELADSIKIGRRQVRLSNVDKVLSPASGMTKGEVVRYYLDIAPHLLPHLKDRPLTLKRYPNGVDQPFFYEKMCPSHRPDWVATTRVETDSRPVDFCVVKEAATLAWVANLA